MDNGSYFKKAFLYFQQTGAKGIKVPGILVAVRSHRLLQHFDMIRRLFPEYTFFIALNKTPNVYLELNFTTSSSIITFNDLAGFYIIPSSKLEFFTPILKKTEYVGLPNADTCAMKLGHRLNNPVEYYTVIEENEEVKTQFEPIISYIKAMLLSEMISN